MDAMHGSPRRTSGLRQTVLLADADAAAVEPFTTLVASNHEPALGPTRPHARQAIEGACRPTPPFSREQPPLQPWCVGAHGGQARTSPWRQRQYMAASAGAGEGEATTRSVCALSSARVSANVTEPFKWKSVRPTNSAPPHSISHTPPHTACVYRHRGRVCARGSVSITGSLSRVGGRTARLPHVRLLCEGAQSGVLVRTVNQQ
jgi:hypothetical protein